MRRAVLIACALAGCAAHTGSRSTAVPELMCLPGTVPTGSMPPNGYSAWCELLLASGARKRQGTFIEWHDNGTKRAQGAYDDDHRTGPWTFWYPTGDVEKQGTYEHGGEQGYWVSFHPAGQRESEGLWVNGLQEGDWTYWSEDGQVRTEGTWERGERSGVWIDYDANDTPIAEKVYRAGRLITRREL